MPFPYAGTARSVEDETRSAELNGNRSFDAGSGTVFNAPWF